MSKAFTKESDDSGDDSPPPLRTQLPAGVTNYITPAGMDKLREELARLSARKEQLTQGEANSSVALQADCHKLQVRIRHLREILASVVVARPPANDRHRIRFGAMVVVRNSEQEQSTYQIVGVDEANPEGGQISWQSPLARQLFNHQAGDRFRFVSPDGEEELEMISV